jgi:plasmid stabilization system protein ParE
MINPKSYTIIWDRSALDEFKGILEYLSMQSSQAPKIVRKGIFSRLTDIEKYPYIFEADKLKDPPNKEFRAFVIYNIRLTYQIKESTQEIRILRIRHIRREPLGY